MNSSSFDTWKVCPNFGTLLRIISRGRELCVEPAAVVVAVTGDDDRVT